MTAPVRVKLKLDFAELARDLALTPGHFPWPFTEELLLEVYRWLVAGAARYAAKGRSTTTLDAALEGIMHGNGPEPQATLWAVYGRRGERTWQEDLRQRLLHLLVAPSFAKLRASLGLDPLRPKMVGIAHVEHGGAAADIRALFAAPRAHRHLNFSPNDCHPGARVVTNVGFCPTPEGWELVIRYGCPDGVGEWIAREPRVVQVKGEPVAWLMRRARAALEAALASPHALCGPPDPRPWGRVRETVQHTYNHLGIGAYCWGETKEPPEPDRQTLEQMAAVAPALERLADARGDRSEAVAALAVMRAGASNANIEARRHLAALERDELPSDAELRRFARVWRWMAEHAVTAPLYSTPGRSIVACFPAPPRTGLA
jgi:hypothetical protein